MSYVILAPALLVPRSRIANKMIPLGVHSEEVCEYIITQFNIVVGAIKDTTLLFRNFMKTIITNNQLAQLLLTTLGDIPLRYAITVKNESADIFELEKFIDDLRLRKLTSINVNDIKDLCKEIVTIVTTKYRTYEIRPLPHLMVFDVNNKILTRVCWLEDVKGSIDVYVGKGMTVLVTDNVKVKEVFIDILDLDKLEDYTPINVPELIDKVNFTEKLMDLWNREIARVRRTEAKKRALALLKGEESEIEKSESESEEGGRIET